jgi:hypothetical protein
MHWPPIESQLLTEGIWCDEEEERGEGEEESDGTVGIEGVPHRWRYTRGCQGPPRGQCAEHHAYGTDAA